MPNDLYNVPISYVQAEAGLLQNKTNTFMSAVIQKLKIKQSRLMNWRKVTKMKCSSGFDSEDDYGFDSEDENFDVEPKPFNDPVDFPRKFDNGLPISTHSVPDQRT